jgi:pilus assembly protein CpaE
MNSTDAKPPFLAFATADSDIDTLKKFASSQSWPDNCIMQGDIRTAAQHLKSHASPVLLLVEIPSAAEAPALLDALAEVCDPNTKVIIIGTVNEYSFYVWLTEIGIFSYLLKPMTQHALEAAYLKSNEQAHAAAKHEKQPGKVIAVLGSRGGVGATMIALNLAALIADLTKKNTALIDIDPHEGSIALTLDMEPNRGFREALEKPDRIDPLFIERVMSKPHKHLAVLSSEEALHERITIHDDAADALLKEMRDKFSVTILDIPRYLNTFSKRCLAQADAVVQVAELTLLSLRDTLRLSDLMRETLKMKQAPIVIVNRVGMSKLEIKPSDFEKGIGTKITVSVPFSPEIFMQIGSEVPSLKSKSHAAVKPLLQLVELLVPEAKSDVAAKGSKGFSMFSGKKKDTKETAETKAK